MATNKTENEKLAPIIIKRVKKAGGAHHGGAWKVAYADFVTAMMAFFLLLWLLNVTTDEQKNAISNYFDPTHPRVSDSTSGAGGLLGGLSVSPIGAMVSTVQPITQPQVPDTSTRGNLHGADQPGDTDGLDASGGFYSTLDMNEEQLEAELRRLEDVRFEVAADALREELAKLKDPEGIADHVLVDVTPEGLRIQIVDDQGRSMFPSGSAVMHGFMRMLLLKVSEVITPLPNPVSVRGHTDSVRYRDPSRYDNWNLSADRAQSSRRVLVEGGVPEARIENVMGRAEREPLLPDDPTNERNRRITVMLMREKRDIPPKTEEKDAKEQVQGQEAPLSHERSQPQESPRQQRPARETPQRGLRIIDDTQPQTHVEPELADPTQTPAQTPASMPLQSGPVIERLPIPQDLQPAPVQPAPALPVHPDGRRPQAAQPHGLTFETGTSAVNKPPTIQTPVFNFGDRKRTTTEPEDKPQDSIERKAPAGAAVEGTTGEGASDATGQNGRTNIYRQLTFP